MTSRSRGAMMSRRSVTGVLAVGLVAAARPALAATGKLRGTVFYRERFALPPAAVVEVRLLDVSLVDAPAKTIAETRVAGNRIPARYVLRFDRSQIRPRHSYALQARIMDGDRLLFINTTRHTVFAGGVDKTDILVQMVRGEPQEPGTASPAGRWLAEVIRGAGVIDRLQTVLEIAADGTISGSGGCNRMSGKARIEGSRISFGPVASTMMACTPAAMDQERRFFAALPDVRSWQINPQHRKLALLGASGKPLVILAQL